MTTQLIRRGRDLVATVGSALDDQGLRSLRQLLIERVQALHPRGIIVDVTALDVMDSFAAATLRELASATQVTGTRTILVGIQPAVAFAMVQVGLHHEAPTTALDVDEACRLLDELSALDEDR